MGVGWASEDADVCGDQDDGGPCINRVHTLSQLEQVLTGYDDSIDGTPRYRASDVSFPRYLWTRPPLGLPNVVRGTDELAAPKPYEAFLWAMHPQNGRASELRRLRRASS